MNVNQNPEMNLMTKREITRVIGDHATFAKKEKLNRMALTKGQEYLMMGLRIYIVAILGVIVLCLLGVL
jgi:hypothetical protein